MALRLCLIVFAQSSCEARAVGKGTARAGPQSLPAGSLESEHMTSDRAT